MVDPPHQAPAPVAPRRGGVPAMQGQTTFSDLVDADPAFAEVVSTPVTLSAAERAAERLRTLRRLS